MKYKEDKERGSDEISSKIVEEKQELNDSKLDDLLEMLRENKDKYKIPRKLETIPSRDEMHINAIENPQKNTENDYGRYW